MKIVFVTNFISLHQSHIADELYRLCDGDYTLVELTGSRNPLKMVPELLERPYLLQAWKGEAEQKRAMELVREADVMMCGGNVSVLPYERERQRTGKLLFDVSERYLKRGIINALSPTIRRYIWNYYTGNHSQMYKLCNSAFLANDLRLLGMYKNRCFKWGYFTKVSELDIDSVLAARSKDKVRIMWVSRIIDWKHPELPVLLGQRLQQDGVDYEINMLGRGDMKDKIAQLIADTHQTDRVHLLGTLPNDEVMQMMREHNIFVFTSDRQEGWGAVLNEAMAQGCCPVVADEIGAAPFLINDGQNGMLFKSRKVESLYEKVRWLIDHPAEREEMGRQAYLSMRNLWTPEIAAQRFYELSENLLAGKQIEFDEGPCSKALPV